MNSIARLLRWLADKCDKATPPQIDTIPWQCGKNGQSHGGCSPEGPCEYVKGYRRKYGYNEMTGQRFR